MHRYDNFPKEDAIKSQYDSITGAITKLYKDKTMNFTKIKRVNKSHVYQNLGSKHKLMLSEIEQKPPHYWNGRESNEFLRIGNSKKTSSHHEYSTCIASHPMLPLYVTGNNKGKISVWPFNSLADDIVCHEYFTYNNKKGESSKKLVVDKCDFSSYGDKLAALNSDGTLFMFNFNYDMENSSPFMKQKSEGDMKLKDFGFLNRDTIIAGVSKRAYGLAIYDLLLPNNKHTVFSSTEIGGTKLCTLQRHQQILCFNTSKNGAMSIFDIRTQKVMSTLQL